MKPSHKPGFFFSSSSYSTLTYINKNDQNGKTTEIPIVSDSQTPVPITVHLPTSLQPPEFAAAVKIQSIYRAHLVRTLVKKIAAVNSETDRLERRIQRQETVDAIRSDKREKLRMNEALMSLLLRLDSVPGIYPAVRELRRSASRRIVGLQEIVDVVSDARIVDSDWFVTNWDQIIEEMEGDVCRERGGEEMERFCVDKLGLRCMERFLRGG